MPTTMVLRFRDLIGPTISRHQDKIKVNRHVWWGWWNKSNELVPRTVFSRFLAQIKSGGYPDVFLVDSGTSQLFRARILGIVSSQTEDPMSCPDQNLTPDYYRTEKYKAWFDIADISPISGDEIRNWSYDEVPEFLDDPTSSRFQGKRVFSVTEMLNRRQRTIYFIRPYQEGKDSDYNLELIPNFQPSNFVRVPISTKSNYIVHISDLHFGVSSHFFALGQDNVKRRKLSTVLYSDIKGLFRDVSPAAIIVTGDLTWQGSVEEFGYAVEFLRELTSIFNLDPLQLIVVPGNHDIQWSLQDTYKYDRTKQVSRTSESAAANYRRFYSQVFSVPAHEYLACGRRFIMKNFQAVDIVGVNSCLLEQKHFAGFGLVSIDQMEKVAEEMTWGNIEDRANWRILAMHHHLIPVTSKEEIDQYDRNYSLTLDAGQMLNLGLKYGVDVVVHGHMHQPFLSTFSRFYKDTSIPSGRSIAVHGAGSAGVNQEHLGAIGKNSYTIFEILPGKVRVRVRSRSENLDGFEDEWVAFIRADAQMGALVSGVRDGD